MNAIESRRLSSRVILWIALAFVLVLYGFPFLYLILTSFKTPSDAIAVPPTVPVPLRQGNEARKFQRPETRPADGAGEVSEGRC